MGEASRRKKGRRQAGGAKGQGEGDTSLTVRPTLQAFVICERVDTLQDGVHTLYRIVDRFNLRIEVRAPKGAPIPQLNVPLSYVLFARFGAGVGRFSASFELFDPDNQSIGKTGENWFWLRTREQGHNIITNVSMPAKEKGPYKWVAYLNGQQVGEFVFTVDFQQVLEEIGPP